MIRSITGLAIAASLISGPATASPSSCSPRWGLVHGSRTEFFTGLGAGSPSDVWAVGYKRSRGLDTPLAEHWDGLSWSRVEIPGIGPTVSGRFADVAVVSSGDIWLAGYVTKGKRSSGVLLHWNGGSWTFTPPIAFPLEDRNYGSAYHALLAIAHDDVWAVANAYTRSAAPLVAAHWDG